MDSTIASNVFSTIDVMRSCTVEFANFGLRSAGIRREASLYLNNGQFYGSRFLVCCQLEKGLIESTSSDTSRSGEIRLVLQTELVVKRGIQSVGGSFSSSNGPILQARV